MIDLSNAPEKGIIYALYVDRVVFEEYKAGDIEEKNLLELHIFDEKKELRIIKSETRGFIEMVIDDASCEYEDTYEETIYTVKDGKITVVNYITYDENDLMRIDNYRLKEAK